MKIEKINDSQIRIFLTREDLLSRQIRLSELAYGTEKARRLFEDMMQKALHDYDFHTENTPLMIEATMVFFLILRSLKSSPNAVENSLILNSMASASPPRSL